MITIFFSAIYDVFRSSLYCIFYCLIHRGFFLIERVMLDSIISWTARCDSSVTAEILPLIVRAISAAFCDCLRWSRSSGPCVKHGMIWRRNRPHKCRRELMELVAKVVLLKIEGSVSRVSSGWSIRREEEMVSGIFWMMLSGESLEWLSLLMSSGDSDGEGHVSLSWYRSEFKHFGCPSAPSFFRLRGKSGVEWVGPGLKSRGVTCNRKGLGQNASLHSESSLKIGEDSWRINGPNLDFRMEEIVWQDWIKFDWSDIPKNLGFKSSLQIWWKFWIRGGSVLRL